MEHRISFTILTIRASAPLSSQNVTLTVVCRFAMLTLLEGTTTLYGWLVFLGTTGKSESVFTRGHVAHLLRTASARAPFPNTQPVHTQTLPHVVVACDRYGI